MLARHYICAVCVEAQRAKIRWSWAMPGLHHHIACCAAALEANQRGVCARTTDAHSCLLSTSVGCVFDQADACQGKQVLNHHVTSIWHAYCLSGIHLLFVGWVPTPLGVGNAL